MGGNGRDPEQRKALQNNTNRWRSGLSGTPREVVRIPLGLFYCSLLSSRVFRDILTHKRDRLRYWQRLGVVRHGRGLGCQPPFIRVGCDDDAAGNGGIDDLYHQQEIRSGSFLDNLERPYTAFRCGGTFLSARSPFLSKFIVFAHFKRLLA